MHDQSRTLWVIVLCVIPKSFCEFAPMRVICTVQHFMKLSLLSTLTRGKAIIPLFCLVCLSSSSVKQKMICASLFFLLLSMLLAILNYFANLLICEKLEFAPSTITEKIGFHKCIMINVEIFHTNGTYFFVIKVAQLKYFSKLRN